MRTHIALLLLMLVGCGGTTLAPHIAPVPSAALVGGETIYFGRTFALTGPASAPLFIYERRVQATSVGAVSTHLTRDGSGALALAESAVHRKDYTLHSYTLHTDQAGRAGSIERVLDGWRFRFDGRERIEHDQGCVVVGPTAVGYILQHLAGLRAGAHYDVRFAVLDRLETLGFTLRIVPSVDGEIRIEMAASRFLVGLIVAPITFTFDSTNNKLVRIEGRVPPKRVDNGRLLDLDARVEYRYVAANYR